MKELRKRFIIDASTKVNYEVLVTAVQLPSGAIETITNYHQLEIKLDDLIERYDDEFRLKSNLNVCIVGYMLV